MKLLFTVVLLSLSSRVAEAQSFTWVFLNKKAHADEIPQAQLDSLMKGHMNNIQRLAREGKLIAAGPFEGGGGIFVFASKSISEVGTWLETDPGVRAGRWTVDILPYHPLVGSICPAKEPYEMVFYTLIRFKPNVTKFNVQQAPEIMKRHDDFLKSLRASFVVLAQGNFGADDGGVMVLDASINASLFEKNPAIQEGFMEMELLRLYIAKGSFCEK